MLFCFASASALLADPIWPQTQEPPPMVRNGLPGEMHKRLDALVGEWDVEKSFYGVLGTSENRWSAKGYSAAGTGLPKPETGTCRT
jgi:hypothetical protein